MKGIPINLSIVNNVKKLAAAADDFLDLEDITLARVFLWVRILVNTINPLATGCWLARACDRDLWENWSWSQWMHLWAKPGWSSRIWGMDKNKMVCEVSKPNIMPPVSLAERWQEGMCRVKCSISTRGCEPHIWGGKHGDGPYGGREHQSELLSTRKVSEGCFKGISHYEDRQSPPRKDSYSALPGQHQLIVGNSLFGGYAWQFVGLSNGTQHGPTNGTHNRGIRIEEIADDGPLCRKVGMASRVSPNSQNPGTICNFLPPTAHGQTSLGFEQPREYHNITGLFGSIELKRLAEISKLSGS